MNDSTNNLLPRFRYGVIHPRGHEGVQRGPGYQFYRLVPLDVIEISTGLGLENYTPAGVEKALGNYWSCVEMLAQEKAQVIIFGGAPVSAVLGRARVIDLLRETKARTGVPADAPLEALIAAMKHLELERLAIGSRRSAPPVGVRRRVALPARVRAGRRRPAGSVVGRPAPGLDRRARERRQQPVGVARAFRRETNGRLTRPPCL